MLKKFISNLSLLLFINLLVKPFWILGIDRTVQNTIGNEAYGQYMVLFNMALLFTMLLDFGINNYTSTFIAKHKQLLDKKFATLIPLKFIFSGAYVALTLGLGLVYGMKGKMLALLMVVALNQVMLFFILFFRANISGLQLFKTDAWLSITDRALMIIIGLAFLLTLKGLFKLEHFILIQTIGYGITLLISFAVLQKQLKPVKLSFNKAMMFSLIKQSWPYALLALLMTIYMRTDILLMKKLLPNGDEQNGIYAAGTRLMEAANMMAGLVSAMLLPLFAKLIKAKEDVNSIVKFSMALLIIPAGCVAAVAWYYHTEIMLLLNQTSPIQSAAVFKFVMLSFVAMCTMYIFGTLLTANGNLKTLNRLAAIALLINLGLNTWLQPKLGAQGAAIAMVFTHGFIALSNAYFAIKYLKLQLNVGYLLKFGIVMLCSVLAVTASKYVGLNFWYSGILTLGVAVLLLFVTKLFQVSQIKQMLQSGNKT